MSKMSEIHMEITQQINDGVAPQDIVQFLIDVYDISRAAAWDFVNALTTQMPY